MISRRHTREYLLSLLYARSYQGESPHFQGDDVYFDDTFLKTIDKKYLEYILQSVKENENHLLSIIHGLAPKFEIETMPRVHVCILLIALAEILYWKEDDINTKISVNEAIELAKKYSDSHGKNFIHGVLSAFLKDREKYENSKPISYHFFS
ncbi:hypothetical protein CSB09_03720 [Candidatus Gracilibacteria bacterium]|nr:MAG: hypothetical protein CSB09_03720 [Candidatus Gracilibacteria bacterium]